MKKILHIPNYYYPHIGGIEQTCRDIVTSLKGKTEQRILCFNSEKKDNIEIVDGIKVTKCGVQAKIMSQSLSKSYGKLLRKEIDDFCPDTIIFHYPNPFPAHYVLKYRKKGIKLILWYHADIIKQKSIAWLFNGQNKRLLKWADKIICTSPNYIEKSKNLFNNKEKCVVIPSCINEERLMLKEEEKNIQQLKKEDKKIIFTFGRHVKYKGLVHLIEASKYLNNDYKIYIGGEGPLTKELKSLAKEDSKIEFMGKLTDSQIRIMLNVCDVFAFPSISKNEAFGLALAEAMYFGKPVVNFEIDGSGVNYVSLDKVTGLTVENGDSKAFANAIKTLAEDELLRNKLGTEAKNRILENFTYKKFKDKVIELIEV